VSKQPAPKASVKKLKTAVKQDDRNANVGTDRGREMIRTSVRDNGAGRSILLDKNGKAIAGNKSAEAMIEEGITEVIEIEVDGSQAVAVKRIDLDLADADDSRARQLAYFDNRTSEVSLEWDPAVLAADIDSLDLSAQFDQGEIDDLLAGLETTPPLSTIDDKHGDEPGLESFWPEIRFKVPPDVFKLYKGKLETTDGDTEAQKFVNLIREIVGDE